jgi:Na+/proline symporter
VKAISKILAPLSLVATILPPLLFMWKRMDAASMKAIMLAATITWFVTAPFWLKGAED